MRVLPALVCQLTSVHEAWVIGSAADPACDHLKVRDYDVMVPFSEWRSAALLIPPGARPNTFGGWKCQSEGRIVDVWPGDLGWLLSSTNTSWAWHPRSGIRVRTRQDT